MTRARTRSDPVRAALRLEALSIGWMLLEGGASLTAGLRARSVALVGFGLDSALELLAAVVLYRRLAVELGGGDPEASEENERKALRVVGATLLLLGVYIVVDSAFTLWTRSEPHKSRIGLAVAVLALLAMPLLSRAKLRLGHVIGSRALVADAKETLACAWLSAAAVAGVGLNAVLGWGWADPVAALAMVPFLVREGREALEEAQGKEGCSSCDDDD